MTPTFQNSNPEMEAQNMGSWASVRVFLRDKYRGVYLWGPCGTGKTFAASCLVSKFKEHERDACMITAPEFVRRMRLFEPGSVLNNWKYSALWVLDDIDKGNWRPGDVRSLWEVLNARLNPYAMNYYHEPSAEYRGAMRIRKTVITGNIPSNELRAYLIRCSDGEETLVKAIMQRLHPLQVLEFSGKSLR